MARPLIVDENSLWPYVTGVLVGPTLESALRNNPGVLNAVAQSRAVILGISMIFLGSAIQLFLAFIGDRRSMERGDAAADRTTAPQPAVGSLIYAAFIQASARQAKLHETWIKISHQIGSVLPASLLSASIQRDGHLDLVLRCIEDDFVTAHAANTAHPFEFHYHKMLSELWVGSMYEIFRLLGDSKRKLIEPNDAFQAIAHDLRLLRIPLEKHEITGDKKLDAPLQLQRNPPRNDESDFFQYSKSDPKRAHIMPSGISPRGSVVWHVIDLTDNDSRWIERRDLSDRIIALWG